MKLSIFAKEHSCELSALHSSTFRNAPTTIVRAGLLPAGEETAGERGVLPLTQTDSTSASNPPADRWPIDRESIADRSGQRVRESERGRGEYLKRGRTKRAERPSPMFDEKQEWKWAVNCKTELRNGTFQFDLHGECNGAMARPVFVYRRETHFVINYVRDPVRVCPFFLRVFSPSARASVTKETRRRTLPAAFQVSRPETEGQREREGEREFRNRSGVSAKRDASNSRGSMYTI